jgi:transcription initiation factor TFIIH subunit 1
VIEDSDSEDEDKKSHVGSKASFMDAQKQILEGVVARRAEIASSGAGSASLSGLSQTTFDRLTLTHATTTEFLHHFWVVFLSGDADRAGELAKMVETLDRAMDRINAVADEAEKERDDIVKKQRQKIRDVFEQTKKKISWSPNSVGGGRKVVMEMVEPTIKSIRTASQQYRKALEAEGVS